MASGIKLSDNAKTCIESIKIHHNKDDPRDRYKVLFFKIENDEIVVDEEECIRVRDVDGEDQDAFKMFQDKLRTYQCCYAVYDCCYETAETEKSELVFIMWAPDSSPIKLKMSYASSKDSIKQVLSACGIKHEWQLNDSTDLTKECILERLGKGIKKLEGKGLTV